MYKKEVKSAANIRRIRSGNPKQNAAALFGTARVSVRTRRRVLRYVSII